MSVPREDTTLAHAKDIDKVAVRDIETQRPEPDVFGLWDPEALVTFEIENARDNKVLGDRGKFGTSVCGLGKVTFFHCSGVLSASRLEGAYF